jgi:hypothetical protein
MVSKMIITYFKIIFCSLRPKGNGQKWQQLKTGQGSNKSLHAVEVTEQCCKMKV